MVTEMMVALMAMIAACVLQPGEYFAINTKGAPTEVVAKVSGAGFPVTEAEMQKLATNLGESTMFNRAGGAPTFAVGMAHMFARVSAKPTALALWYTSPSCLRRCLFSRRSTPHTRRAFSASGLPRQRLASSWQYTFVEREFFLEPVIGGGMGLVSICGRD
jgi:hypothetical protein